MTTVDDALLTRVTRGPLGTLDPPRRWFRGAVYDSDGKLVKASQRLGGVNGYNWAPADGPRIPSGKRAERPEVEGLAPMSVDRLVVPGRAVVANGWAHPEAVAVWDRVATPFRGGSGPARVFLSRTAHNEQRRAVGHRSAQHSSS